MKRNYIRIATPALAFRMPTPNRFKNLEFFMVEWGEKLICFVCMNEMRRLGGS